MPRLCATLTAAAALLAGSVLGAQAADLYGRGGGSIKDGYVPMHTPSPSAWYIRGDIGWAQHDDPKMIEVGRWDLFGTKIEETWTIGGGVGYKFSRNVRGDLTYDHRFEADAQGRIGNDGLFGGGMPFPGGVRKFGLRSDVILANVYYDADFGGRFTPYIGIGIGTTHNTTTRGTVVDACDCSGTATIAGKSNWSVAGALMSGFSMNLGHGPHGPGRWNLDAGYRLLYLGDAHTGVITGATRAGAPQSSGDPHVQDIWAHELRVGLRMDIR